MDLLHLIQLKSYRTQLILDLTKSQGTGPICLTSYASCSCWFSLRKGAILSTLADKIKTDCNEIKGEIICSIGVIFVKSTRIAVSAIIKSLSNMSTLFCLNFVPGFRLQ